MSEKLYEVITYYAIALDPIHIGAGGARLGRVDLPIIKEPGTGIPKIPGTSLSGPARAYTAIAIKPNRYVWTDSDGKEYSCAGSGGERGEKHCGKVKSACPVCVPYGFSKGSGNSMQGLAQFFDAHILLFPIASLAGTIWVTSPMVLESLDLASNFSVEGKKFHPLSEQITNDKLNFGWLMLERGDGNGSSNSLPKEIPDIIRNKAVLVPDDLFPKIVNANLEVRTSVIIDPATGAAEDGALFTYEATPRGTVFMFDVICNSGKYFNVGGQEIRTEKGEYVEAQLVKKWVEKGLKLFETLGIGGMGTRGMGRLKVLNLEREDC